MFHPVPLGMETKGQFQYTIALYESGFGTLSLVPYPPHYTSDLTNCFFDFSTLAILIFLAFYLLIILILTYLFAVKLQESALIIYRIMFKEHNLKLSVFPKHRWFNRGFLVAVLLYYLLLNILVESNVSWISLDPQNVQIFKVTLAFFSWTGEYESRCKPESR